MATDDGVIVAERTFRRRGRVRIRIEFAPGRLALALANADAGFVDEQGRSFVTRDLVRALARVEDAIGDAAEDAEREETEREVRVARASRPQVVVAGRTAGTTCPAIVRAHGHSDFDTNNCVAGVDLLCVDTVLSLGHEPWDIRHCKDVDGACAEEELLGGADPFFVRGRCRR